MTLLDSLLAPDQTPREVEDGISSVLPEESPSANSSFDKAANGYDLLIGNPLYNRVCWGTWPSAYSAHCREALQSASEGPVLDAGCGTLISTAEEYLRTDRPIVLLDSSLGMLLKARARLLKGRGSIPSHITLLQADVTDLPFRSASFTTVTCWGVLHLFDDPVPVAEQLGRVTATDGRIFTNSLVAGRQFGERYIRFLSTKGIMAPPMSSADLTELLAGAGFAPSCEVRGNMAFVSAGKWGGSTSSLV
jgi:ubiquinone/menaquinone biosynthesis C-methylase UbiE